MLHALIVDDNPLFRRDLGDVISQRFPAVAISQVGDTISAWDELKTQTVDVVFVDIELPGESGLALTRRLNHSHPELIKVVMTVHDLPEFREAALASGADYFMPKESLEALEAVFSIMQHFPGFDDRPSKPAR